MNLFCNNARRTVEIARPSLIMIEDEYSVAGNHRCFCDRHLQEFAGRVGRSYSREELQALFVNTGKEPEARRLSDLYDAMLEDSLVALSAALRRAIDTIDPAIRIGLCQPGGRKTGERIARALAGKTQPLVRAHGTSYHDNQSYDIQCNLPRHMFNSLCLRQWLPADYEIIHESDTYYNTGYFMSGAKLRAYLTVAALYGLDGSYLIISQLLDAPQEELESGPYLSMFKESRGWLDALRKASIGCRVTGIDVGVSREWVELLGRMGLPYTSRNGDPDLGLPVSRAELARMSDAELTERLSGHVVVDGQTAMKLCERGMGDLIGANVQTQEASDFNSAGYERITDEGLKLIGTQGRLMRCSPACAFNVVLEPAPGAIVLTEIVSRARDHVLGAGMTLFVNRLGGRVAVMSGSLSSIGKDSVYTASQLFNYRKRALLRKVIEWARAKPFDVCLEESPNTFFIVLEHKTGKYLIACIINMTDDAREKVCLTLSSRMNGAALTTLAKDGTWRDMDFKVEHSADKAKTICAELPCLPMSPAVMMLRLNE